MYIGQNGILGDIPSITNAPACSSVRLSESVIKNLTKQTIKTIDKAVSVLYPFTLLKINLIVFLFSFIICLLYRKQL